MSSISSQYTVPLYSLYQAGQGNSASGQGSSSSTTSSGISVSSQAATNLANLGDALQSGDLSDAQNALFTLQAGLTGEGLTNVAPTATSSTGTDSSSGDNNPSGPFTNNAPANADYQSMVLNLGSGNLAAAAKDYTQLQMDLKLHSQQGGARASVAIDIHSTSDSTSGNVFSVTV